MDTAKDKQAIDALAGSGAATVYTSNGSLSGNRTIDLQNNSLTFKNDSNNIAVVSNNATFQGTSNVASNVFISNTQNKNTFLNFKANGTDKFTLGYNGTSEADSFLIFDNKNNKSTFYSDTSGKVILGATGITPSTIDSEYISLQGNTQIKGDFTVKHSNGTANNITLENIVDKNAFFVYKSANTNRFAMGYNGFFESQAFTIYSYTGNKSVFYIDGSDRTIINGGGTAPNVVGSEKISLQGHTLVKGADTLGTSSALQIYDGDSTPAVLWDFRNNGDIVQGVNSIYNFNGKILNFDASSGGEMKITGNTTKNYYFLTNQSTSSGYTNSTRLLTSQGSAGIKSSIDNYYSNTAGTDTRLSRLTLKDDSIQNYISKNGGILAHNFVSSLGNTETATFDYVSRFSHSYILRFNIGGTYTAEDYYRITTGLDYILDRNNTIGFNIGIGTNDTPVAKLTVNGDVILNGTTKIGTEDVSLQGSTLINGTLDMNNNRITKAVINPSVNEAASSATFTINADQQSDGVLTAMSAATTIAAPTGTPVQSQSLVFRFTDDGTARAITWNAIFRAIGVTLPTTTTASKLLYVGCKYNSTNTKWDVVSVQEEA